MRKIIGNAFIYTGSEVLNSAVPFLLLPVLTRYLAPGDYGVVAMFISLFNIAIIVVGLNTSAAIVVYYFRLTPEQLRIFIGNIVIILAVSSCVALAVILLTKGLIIRFLPFSTVWLVLLVITSTTFFVSFINLRLWLAEQRPVIYGLYQLLLTVANIGLSLLLVVGLGMKWQGRVLGLSGATILFGIISLVIIYRRKLISFSPDRKMITEALRYSLPLIPSEFSGSMRIVIDRLMLAAMTTLAATGLYVVGYQIGLIMAVLVYAFHRAYEPFLYRRLATITPEDKRRFVRVTYLYFFGVLACASILTVGAPLLLKIFAAKDYSESYVYVGWIAFGYAFYGMSLMVLPYILFQKRTMVLAYVSLIGTGIQIILCYVLIRREGPLGAAHATLISFFLSFILVWIVSAHAYPMNWFYFLNSKSE